MSEWIRCSYCADGPPTGGPMRVGPTASLSSRLKENSVVSCSTRSNSPVAALARVRVAVKCPERMSASLTRSLSSSR